MIRIKETIRTEREKEEQSKERKAKIEKAAGELDTKEILTNTIRQIAQEDKALAKGKGRGTKIDYETMLMEKLGGHQGEPKWTDPKWTKKEIDNWK